MALHNTHKAQRAVPLNPADPDTWPMVLRIEDIAAIYRRSVLAIRHACKPSAKVKFRPAPFQTRPYRWRKADVLRDVQGARTAA
jgi:hypothetical protein